jgi:hypothetical protein
VYFHLKNVETSAKVVLRFNVTMLKSLLLVISWDCPFLSILDFLRLWVCTLWFSWFLILFNNLHSVNHLIPWIFHITEPVLPSLFSSRYCFLIWWQIPQSSTHLVYIADDKCIYNTILTSLLPVKRCYMKLCPSKKVPTCSMPILEKLLIKYGRVPVVNHGW